MKIFGTFQETIFFRTSIIITFNLVLMSWAVCYQAETNLSVSHSSKRPFSWFASRNITSLNSARRQKDLFSPLRSAIIWKVEVHALNRIPVSCVAAWMSSPPTTQHGSSKLPLLPPVTGAAQHHLASASSYSLQVFVFGSVCLCYTLGSLKHLGNR